MLPGFDLFVNKFAKLAGNVHTARVSVALVFNYCSKPLSMLSAKVSRTILNKLFGLTVFGSICISSETANLSKHYLRIKFVLSGSLEHAIPDLANTSGGSHKGNV